MGQQGSSAATGGVLRNPKMKKINNTKILKPIRLSGHARSQLNFRGVTEEEVIEAIRSASWTETELNRLECRKGFLYGNEWNKKYYESKQIRPILWTKKPK